MMILNDFECMQDMGVHELVWVPMMGKWLMALSEKAKRTHPEEDDVVILRRGCASFLQFFMEQCDVDLFAEAVTLPVACSKTLPETKKTLPLSNLKATDPREAIPWPVCTGYAIS